MKKKEFNAKLTLGKKVISNLQKNSLQGGTGTTMTVPITTVIRNMTQPFVCTTKYICTLHCETDGCSNDCSHDNC